MDATGAGARRTRVEDLGISDGLVQLSFLVQDVLARVERRGLLKRTVVPEDRRAVRVALTARGRELAAVLTEQMDRELHRLVEGLAESNRKRLSVLASQVVQLHAHDRGIDLSADVNPPSTGARHD